MGQYHVVDIPSQKRYGGLTGAEVCNLCGDKIDMEDEERKILKLRVSYHQDVRWRHADCHLRMKTRVPTPRNRTPKPDYQISEIQKAGRCVQMKWRVDNDIRVKDLDDKEGRTSTVVALVGNYAATLSGISTGQKRYSHGRHYRRYSDISTYAKHRMAVWVAFSKELKPFLKRITATMLERIYLRNLNVMKEKGSKRAELNIWRENQAKKPVRLFPITESKDRFLARVLPLFSERLIGAKIGYNPISEEELARMGVPKEGFHNNYAFAFSVQVYNTPKGPRFVVEKDIT